MTKEDAKYIWTMMLDEIQSYGTNYWCNDRDINIDKFKFFCENVDTMIQETDWNTYGKQE